MSRREDALTEFRGRLAGILTADGFNTDAGALLFIGEQPVLGPDDPGEAIAMVVRPDDAGYQGENVFVVIPVEIHAIVKVSETYSATESVRAWKTVEAVVSDIKQAIEIDHDLGGTLVRRGLERGATRPLDREDGSTSVGAVVEYRLSYVEAWGRP